MSNEEIRALIQWINQYGLKKINEKGKDIILEALERQLDWICFWDSEEESRQMLKTRIQFLIADFGNFYAIVVD